jgi:hypothetical protein
LEQMTSTCSTSDLKSRYALEAFRAEETFLFSRRGHFRRIPWRGATPFTFSGYVRMYQITKIATHMAMPMNVSTFPYPA